MNRRGFLLGAGLLAAPSIIGVSGIIQLSRPLVVSTAWYRIEARWIEANYENMQTLSGRFRNAEEAIAAMHLPPSVLPTLIERYSPVYMGAHLS